GGRGVSGGGEDGSRGGERTPFPLSGRGRGPGGEDVSGEGELGRSPLSGTEREPGGEDTGPNATAAATSKPPRHLFNGRSGMGLASPGTPPARAPTRGSAAAACP